MSRCLLLVLLVLNDLLIPLYANNYYRGENNNNPWTRENSSDPHIPGEHMMDTKLLREILGESKDDFLWMSIGRPSKIYEPGVKGVSANQRLDVLLTFKNYTLKDEEGELIDANKKIVQAVRRWMVKEATCRVDYLWKRLDDRYWPSWIKHVFCDSSESCSWPPGMTCQPIGVKKLRLLKWTCLSDPLSTRWNEFKLSVMEDRRRMRIRRKKRLSQRRHHYRNSNHFNKALRPKRKKRMINQYLYRTSKHARGFLCQWKPVDYSISESCSCNCQ